MKLSLLDRSRTRAGRPDAEGLTGSVERAVRAESLGYGRFWVAEHHAVPGIASGAPAVLLAAVGTRTQHIRIGSGGVMLPHHQPLIVAEQFLTLEALFPGRVDLGLGRSPGFTPPVREALRRAPEGTDAFESDLVELRGFLDGTQSVTARPRIDSVVPMYVLATGRGTTIAARLGLPVVIGGPGLHDESLAEILATYRREFRPSERSPQPDAQPDDQPDDQPHVTISLDVTVADTDEAARDLALPEAWAMAKSRRTGEFSPLESVRDIRSVAWPDQLRTRIEHSLESAVAGSPDTVRRLLDELVSRTGADELLASTSTYDRDELFGSDAALRDLVLGG